MGASAVSRLCVFAAGFFGLLWTAGGAARKTPEPRVIWFATYPHTGNTWIRNLWEVSTGIATGTVFPGENNNGAWFHPCGTNAGRDHHDCTKIHSPRMNETRFVKTHFPTIRSHTPTKLDGAVITHRSPTSWCEAHVNGTRVFQKAHKSVKVTSIWICRNESTKLRAGARDIPQPQMGLVDVETFTPGTLMLAG